MITHPRYIRCPPKTRFREPHSPDCVTPANTTRRLSGPRRARAGHLSPCLGCARRGPEPGGLSSSQPGTPKAPFPNQAPGTSQTPTPNPAHPGANSPSGTSRPTPPEREFPKRKPRKRNRKSRFPMHIPGLPGRNIPDHVSRPEALTVASAYAIIKPWEKRTLYPA